MDYQSYLKSNSLSAAIFHGEALAASSIEHGVLPMLRFYRDGILKDAVIADKVIGKAAASIAVIGNAKEVYATVGSDCGAKILEAAGIPFHFEEKVPVIRTPSGELCPMERLTGDSKDASEALTRIEAFFAEKGLY